MRTHWGRAAMAVVAIAAAVSAPTGGAAQAVAKSAAAASGAKYTAADVQFMQGMIHHHAQAVIMAAMAPSHGAGKQLSVFCRKVMVSQRDEILLMQTWLKDHGETVPSPSTAPAHNMAGMNMPMEDHTVMMPGMLSAEQMATLEKARGVDFDRYFLTYMIQHHEGALTMVATLFNAPGAGQTPEVFGFASGVDADQRGEIERMQQMLATLSRSKH